MDSAQKLCDYAISLIMARHEGMKKRRFVLFPILWTKIRMRRIKRLQRLAAK